MFWKERVVGWFLVVVVTVGAALLVAGQEEQDSEVAKANLAGTLFTVGDPSGARQRWEEALAVLSRVLGEGHSDTLAVQINLAGSFDAVEDLPGARQRWEEALPVLTRILGEEHPRTLSVKVKVAESLRSLGDLSGARQYEEEVLAVRTRILGEQHPKTLRVKANLAQTLRWLGDLAGARQHSEEVLAARTRILGEQHPQALTAKANLAGVLYVQGDLAGAQQLYTEVIETRARAFGPSYRLSTAEEANEFFWLARTLRRLGELEGASWAYQRGLDALEAQILRSDFSEDGRSQLKELYSVAYHETVSTDLKRNQLEDAFLLLERYRTQSLMNLLRLGRPGSGVEIPDQWRIELAEIAQRYDWLTRRIDSLYPERDPALDAEQAQLRRRREGIQGQIIELRREAEGVPEAPVFETLRASLDPGTVLLAYSIGSNESYLFVLSQEDGIEVHSIGSRASQLWTQVGRLRTMDLEKGDEGAESDKEGRQALAGWLFDKLLRPATDRIDAAERVLILPDGPLYYLPFPALTRSVAPTRGDPRGWQYLAEWKPFHTVQSATVYAELQARRPEPPGGKRPVWQWVGFGDPFYPSSQTAEASSPALASGGGQPTDAPWAVLRSTQDRGIWDGLSTLPHTQREIEEIQSQFPEGQAKAFLDRQATEDEARKLLGTTRIAHFAAHGLADPDYPLDSFLALSLLDGEDLEHNGLLQAWEIIDHLQLDADLVVLSACVTAFGPERGGEGLISLSRAFQIAGARSVLASLWAVNDQSTSELMIRFYRNLLEEGMSKDAALQQAQIELIRGPIETVDQDGSPAIRDFSAAYHWAAFRLLGDWR